MSICRRHYGQDAKLARPDVANWIGSEIKSSCKLPSLEHVPLVQAAQNVVLVAVNAGDMIENLQHGLPVGVCRRIELVCIRGRRERVAVGFGRSCGKVVAERTITAARSRSHGRPE